MESAKKINSKIDVRDIVTDHWATIVNANTNRPDTADILVFMVFPVLISATLLYFKAMMSDNIIGDIISGLSIFVGLLLNVLVIIFDIVKRDSFSSIKNELLKQSLTNISFAILLSLLCIITCIATLIKYEWVKLIATGVTYTLLIEFIACLLMIMKRMYKLLMNEFKKVTTNA